MPDFYSQAHLVVVPSRSDTFGLTILESCMCGTMVVTSPLLTHKNLRLPLHYSTSVYDYVNKILFFKNVWDNNKDDYFNLSKECRKSAMKYDAPLVLNNIEHMLREENFRMMTN